VVLDKRTGRELWRVEREEGTSWATPLIVKYKGIVHIVTSAMSEAITWRTGRYSGKRAG
jgi:outer membrane protein assembly factor BamB